MDFYVGGRTARDMCFSHLLKPTRHKFESGGPAKLLLLAMFALAARYLDPEASGQSNHGALEAGNIHMEEAKSLLSRLVSSTSGCSRNF